MAINVLPGGGHMWKEFKRMHEKFGIGLPGLFSVSTGSKGL